MKTAKEAINEMFNFMERKQPMAASSYGDVLDFCKKNKIETFNSLRKGWISAYKFISSNKHQAKLSTDMNWVYIKVEFDKLVYFCKENNIKNVAELGKKNKTYYNVIRQNKKVKSDLCNIMGWEFKVRVLHSYESILSFCKENNISSLKILRESPLGVSMAQFIIKNNLQDKLVDELNWKKIINLNLTPEEKIERKKELAKAYREKNNDKFREYSKKYYKKNYKKESV